MAFVSDTDREGLDFIAAGGVGVHGYGESVCCDEGDEGGEEGEGAEAELHFDLFGFVLFC